MPWSRGFASTVIQTNEYKFPKKSTVFQTVLFYFAIRSTIIVKPTIATMPPSKKLTAKVIARIFSPSREKKFINSPPLQHLSM
jgi:hypothetical protein